MPLQVREVILRLCKYFLFIRIARIETLACDRQELHEWLCFGRRSAERSTELTPKAQQPADGWRVGVNR